MPKNLYGVINQATGKVQWLLNAPSTTFSSQFTDKQCSQWLKEKVKGCSVYAVPLSTQALVDRKWGSSISFFLLKLCLWAVYFRLFYIIQLTDKFLPMLGFELQIFGVGSNCSANCATTTANSNFVLYLDFDNFTANKIVLACFHRCNCSALELSSDPI